MKDMKLILELIRQLEICRHLDLWEPKVFFNMAERRRCHEECCNLKFYQEPNVMGLWVLSLFTLEKMNYFSMIWGKRD